MRGGPPSATPRASSSRGRQSEQTFAAGCTGAHAVRGRAVTLHTFRAQCGEGDTLGHTPGGRLGTRRWTPRSAATQQRALRRNVGRRYRVLRTRMATFSALVYGVRYVYLMQRSRSMACQRASQRSTCAPAHEEWHGLHCSRSSAAGWPSRTSACTAAAHPHIYVRHNYKQAGRVTAGRTRRWVAWYLWTNAITSLSHKNLK